MRRAYLAVRVILVCVAVQSSALWAGDRAPTLNLEDCLRGALESNPEMDLIAADLALARARLDEAKAGRLGEIEYTQIVGLVNEARGDAVFSPDSQTDFFDDLGPFTRLELDLRIPIYTFGKLSAALEAAEQGLRSARAKGEASRADLVLEIKRLYYGLLLSQDLSAVLGDMLENMDEAVETTRRRLDDDRYDVTELDLLRLRIGRSKFAAGVEKVETSTQLTRSALARAVGLDAGAEYELAERRLRPVAFEAAPLEQYVEAGPERRPEWTRIAAGIEAQEALVDLQEASYYPTLFFATGVHYAVAGNRDDQKNPFVYDQFNYLQPIGVLGIRWDLNIFETRARAAQARADRQRLLAERRRAETGLRLEVERSYRTFERARATIEAARAGRKAAKGLLFLTVSNYDLGIGDAQDLFEAYGSYTETSTDYFRAVHDFNLAVAELSRSVGEELLDLEY